MGHFHFLGDAYHFNWPKEKNVESFLNYSRVGHLFILCYCIVPVEFLFIWCYKAVTELVMGLLFTFKFFSRMVAISTFHLIELASISFLLKYLGYTMYC